MVLLEQEQTDILFQILMSSLNISTILIHLKKKSKSKHFRLYIHFGVKSEARSCFFLNKLFLLLLILNFIFATIFLFNLTAHIKVLLIKMVFKWLRLPAWCPGTSAPCLLISLLIALRWVFPCCLHCWVGKPVMTHLQDWPSKFSVLENTPIYDRGHRQKKRLKNKHSCFSFRLPHCTSFYSYIPDINQACCELNF